MTATPLVECRGLGYAAAGRSILTNVDLTLHPGEVIGVVGANGSGKTTLIRLLSTLLAPTAGSRQVLSAGPGADRTTLRAVRRDIAMIGHAPAVWPELTLAENVDLVDALAPGTDHAEPLRAVGLAAAADRRADRASVGMQRRVEFARLLRRTPHLLLLDEAHSGLDADAVSIVSEVIRRVSGSGGSTVLVSHHLAHLEELATKLFSLSGGTISVVGR